MEVYACMENNSDEMRRLIHEFCLLCQEQEIDHVDRSTQRKRIMHQMFRELEEEDPSVALDFNGVPYSAAD